MQKGSCFYLLVGRPKSLLNIDIGSPASEKPHLQGEVDGTGDPKLAKGQSSEVSRHWCRA